MLGAWRPLIPPNFKDALDRFLQPVDQVGLLPAEQIALRPAAEMAVGGGLLVDRLVEPEMGADAPGGEAQQGRQDLPEPPGGGAVQLGAVQIDVERERLGD